MSSNPFRDALVTFDLLPDELHHAFINALESDWDDLEHNGNPIEHTPAKNREEAIEYVEEWGEGGPFDFDPRDYLLDLAVAWDFLEPHLPPEETTEFGGETISSGRMIAVRDCVWTGPELKFVISDVDDDGNDSPTTYTVRMENHTPVELNVS